MVVILWGVSGAGKTTIGELLARELGWKFIEADDFHSGANIDKMRRGEPLTDEDRQPWLERLRAAIKESLDNNENAVLACSALKKKYRDRLRVSDQVKFVFLRGSREQIAERLHDRRGHFFNPDLLASQFADLEEPRPAEDALTVELGAGPAGMADTIQRKLKLRKQPD
jgi:gluconokinase